MKKAMFTIEVLISILILFLVVTLSASSSKFLNKTLSQQEKYKKIYQLVPNIKEKNSDICQNSYEKREETEGIVYELKCQLIQEKRGLVKDYDFDTGQLHITYTGTFTFQLYKVQLAIPKYGYEIEYYLNRYKK